MTKIDKLTTKILNANSDNNISFLELCNLLENFGFTSRTKGSHHIFYHKSIPEIINLQAEGNKAKAYQVKQVRELILKYKMNKP